MASLWKPPPASLRLMQSRSLFRIMGSWVRAQVYLEPNSQLLPPGRRPLAIVLSVIYTLARGSLQFISQGPILGSFQTLENTKTGEQELVSGWELHSQHGSHQSQTSPSLRFISKLPILQSRSILSLLWVPAREGQGWASSPDTSQPQGQATAGRQG